MPKKDESVTELNPQLIVEKLENTKTVLSKDLIELSDAERAVLKTVLDRDRTSKLVHGGLKSLLTLTDDQAKVLLGFLTRI